MKSFEATLQKDNIKFDNLTKKLKVKNKKKLQLLRQIPPDFRAHQPPF